MKPVDHSLTPGVPVAQHWKLFNEFFSEALLREKLLTDMDVPAAPAPMPAAKEDGSQKVTIIHAAWMDSAPKSASTITCGDIGIACGPNNPAQRRLHHP